MRADPKRAKNTVKPSVFDGLLGSPHKKAARKMLVKLTPGVNFIHILRVRFLPISFCQKVSKPNISAINFWRKKFYTKNECKKTLIKLTTDVLLWMTSRLVSWTSEGSVNTTKLWEEREKNITKLSHINYYFAFEFEKNFLPKKNFFSHFFKLRILWAR